MRRPLVVPLIGLVVLACLAPVGLEHPPGDPTPYRRLLQFRCPGTVTAGISPRALWLATDSAPEGTIRVDVLPESGVQPEGCTFTSTGFGLGTQGLKFRGLQVLGDTTFLVALEADVPGYDTVWVAVNTDAPRPVPVLMASRAFASTTIGHRGAGWGWPENTLLSLRVAADAGILASEVDVRLSRDTVPLLMHDNTVDRTTNGHGAVGEMTAPELVALDAGFRFGTAFAGERVPTLEQALLATDQSRHTLVLDIKRQAVISPRQEAQLLAELASQHNATDRILLLSDDTVFLREARQASATIGLLLLSHEYWAWHRVFARSIALSGVVYHPAILASSTGEGALDAVASDGVLIVANTTNDLASAESIIRFTPVRRILTDIVPMLVGVPIPPNIGAPPR